MNEFKLPKNVQAAIDAYKQVEEKMRQRRESVEERKQRLQRELADTEQKLKEAMAVTLDNPTKANEDKETELRRRVADLKMAIAGAEERSNYAFHDGMDEGTRLAKEAIAVAKAEGERYFYEHIDEKLKAVEDAKYAYLRALVDVNELYQYANDVWQEAGRQTNPNYVMSYDRPNVHADILHIPITKELQGMNELEVTRAAKHGVIRPTSCGQHRATVKQV